MQKMKQIEERYLVLVAACFALMIGVYSFYSVVKIVAQTTDSELGIGTDDSSTTTIKEEPEPESEPEPIQEDASVETDQPVVQEDAKETATTKETTAKTEGANDDDSTSADDWTANKDTIDDTSSSAAIVEDEAKTYTTEADQTKDASTFGQVDDTTSDYDPDDPKYTVLVDASLIKDQKNPYIGFSAGTIEVNVKEYIGNFVIRAELERVFAKQQHELSDEERQKIARAKREAMLDSDIDGIPDYEEIRLGTNIFAADSDGDGFEDGRELRNGYDPRKFSAGDGADRISYQDPEKLKEISPVFRVTKIRPGAEIWDEDRESAELELAGTALPNSMVTLYIYSDPIVVTVQADNDGNWYYVLGKELEAGEHRVYATVTDSTGKVTSRSEGLVFVKPAKALVEAEAAQKKQLETQMVSPVNKAKSRMALFGLTIAIVSIVVAFISIGYFLKTRECAANKQKDVSGDNELQ